MAAVEMAAAEMVAAETVAAEMAVEMAVEMVVASVVEAAANRKCHKFRKCRHKYRVATEAAASRRKYRTYWVAKTPLLANRRHRQSSLALLLYCQHIFFTG